MTTITHELTLHYGRTVVTIPMEVTGREDELWGSCTTIADKMAEALGADYGFLFPVGVDPT